MRKWSAGVVESWSVGIVRGRFLTTNKIVFTLSLCSMLFGPNPSSDAQQPKRVPRIGFVDTEGNPQAPGPQFEAFRQGLRDLGYIEGGNILIEIRYPEEKSERTASLVTELVQLKVDLLIVGAQPAIRAAQRATNTIPVVIVTTQNPVAAGFVESLARPGGNITGLTRPTRELAGKRLELLKKYFRIHRA